MKRTVSRFLMMCCTVPLLVVWVWTSAAAQDSDLQAARLADDRRVEIIARAVEASICVFSADGNGGGSGVVVSPDGYALTNYHVVKPCGTYMHCSMPDGNLYDAVLVGVDPTGDVALIRLLGRNDFPVADLGDSDALRTGDHCFAVGNPFLLATNFEPSVSWGIVSGVHRYQYPAGTLLEYADCIQTDAAINPGNSGGPLFNGQGQLVGINGRGSFEKRGRVNVGVGYAISINQIRLYWNHLASGRIVDHATLGATVTSDNQGRVVVDNVLNTSDAFRRGLRYGDEIISFGDRTIETVNEFKNVLGIYPKGWRVPLHFRRNDEEFITTVRLAGMHSTEELVDSLRVSEAPDHPKGPPKADGKKRKTHVPESASQLIESRYGFANYYFNRQKQNEVWAGFLRHGDTVAAAAKWQITGKLDDGTQIRVVLGLEQSGIQWGDSAAVLETGIDLHEQLLPDGTGGLLVALKLWHRLLSVGPEAYGDVFYLGALPRHNQSVANVITGRFDSMETRFFFDPESHQLTELEMWSDPGMDPCEIEFAEFRLIEGIVLPHRWTIRHGDDFFWTIHVESFARNKADE